MVTYAVFIACIFASTRGWLFSSPSSEPRRVCYASLDTCYSDEAPNNNVPGFLPLSPEDQATEFWLFTRGFFDEYEVLKYDDDSSILDSRFDSSLWVKVIIHGFGEWGNKSWVRAMRDTILQRDNVNVIIVHWKTGAHPPNYQQSVANTRVVGTVLAKLILRINALTGASLSNFHLIGHSLGAHVAGYAGQELDIIGRITGLDPAGPHFNNFGPAVTLDASDASFVDVIHTNARPLRQFGYGIQASIGHVDFFPNGGVQQPGCPISLRGIFLLINGRTAEAIESLACNHERGFAYFIASINGSTFQAYPCAGKIAYDVGMCTVCGTGCAYMGYYADLTNPTGTFYLQTGSDWPEYPQDLSEGVLSVID